MQENFTLRSLQAPPIRPLQVAEMVVNERVDERIFAAMKVFRESEVKPQPYDKIFIGIDPSAE